MRKGKAISGSRAIDGALVSDVDFKALAEHDEYPVVFAAKNHNDAVRGESSSGGMFHALASYVINNQNGVVYGCAFDGNLRAVHIRCETMVEVERCMGSKYSQSDMGEAIPHVKGDLEAGRIVLFTGTPCQVAAVQTACTNAAGGGVLIAADIVCHGVPSPEVFQEWLHELEEARGAVVVRYEHRPKSTGWGHSERVTFDNGMSEQQTSWSEAWKRYYYDNRSLRPSCYRCPYTTVTNRPGDVTIADFWGIENTKLSGFYDTLGVSLVLANNERGLKLLAESDVDYALADISDALPGNPMLEHPSTYKGELHSVWKSIYRDGLLATMRRKRFLVSPASVSFTRLVKKVVKSALGRGRDAKRV